MEQNGSRLFLGLRYLPDTVSAYEEFGSLYSMIGHGSPVPRPRYAFRHRSGQTEHTIPPFP